MLLTKGSTWTSLKLSLDSLRGLKPLMLHQSLPGYTLHLVSVVFCSSVISFFLNILLCHTYFLNCSSEIIQIGSQSLLQISLRRWLKCVHREVDRQFRRIHWGKLGSPRAVYKKSNSPVQDGCQFDLARSEITNSVMTYIKNIFGRAGKPGNFP